MSIEVKAGELSEMLARFPFLYLLTVGEQRRPHISALTARVTDGVVVVSGAGRRSHDRIATNPLVTLLAPPYEPGGYSLIVDGTGRSDGDVVLVSPTRAVLHRPASVPAPSVDGDCAQDCVEVGGTSE
ncbi:MAG TPA: pyridoxamine 5'-phosphate oxidase family protein [Sporichthyaceae bacterium]|nr:pyridoxamine 5'-phosphate oxidase family protein [Sporichthyaceae bacterium]